MPIPWGYTRGNGDPEARKAWLKETIETIEDAWTSGAASVSYPNAGAVENLHRADMESRIRQLFVQYAKLTGDAALMAEVRMNPRWIRLIGMVGYTSPGASGGWGYVP